MTKTIKKIREEAPTVNAGSGEIAGIGVGPKGEPGVSPDNAYKKENKKKKRKIKDIVATLFRRSPPQMVAEQSTFAGKQVFVVPSQIFNEMKMQKRKGKHWSSYIKEDDYMQPIREYANKNPKKPIIIQCENTGAMMYARYPKS
jgi:hypothetical protein